MGSTVGVGVGEWLLCISTVACFKNRVTSVIHL
jgi:hypothetical protein